MELGRGMSYQMTFAINRVTRVVQSPAIALNSNLLLDHRNLFVVSDAFQTVIKANELYRHKERTFIIKVIGIQEISVLRFFVR